MPPRNDEPKKNFDRLIIIFQHINSKLADERSDILRCYVIPVGGIYSVSKEHKIPAASSLVKRTDTEPFVKRCSSGNR